MPSVKLLLYTLYFIYFVFISNFNEVDAGSSLLGACTNDVSGIECIDNGGNGSGGIVDLQGSISALMESNMPLEFNVGASRIRIGKNHAEVLDSYGRIYKFDSQATGVTAISFDRKEVLQFVAPTPANSDKAHLLFHGKMNIDDILLTSLENINTACTIRKIQDPSMPCSGPQSLQVTLLALSKMNTGTGTGTKGDESSSHTSVTEERVRRMLDSVESTTRNAIHKAEQSSFDKCNNKIDEAIQSNSELNNKKNDATREVITTEIRNLSSRINLSEQVVTSLGTADDAAAERAQHRLWKTINENNFSSLNNTVNHLIAASNNGSIEALQADVDSTLDALTLFNDALMSHNQTFISSLEQIQSSLIPMNGLTLESYQYLNTSHHEYNEHFDGRMVALEQQTASALELGR